MLYTWDDGGRTRRAWLQTDLAVQPSTDNASDDVVVRRGDSESIVKRQAGDAQEGSNPVFRTASGALMTLPGGVLLLLDPEWDQARVDRFFFENAVAKTRVSDREFGENAFFVETAPGFPANGSDSFTYTVSDGEYPSTATVSVLILPVNDPPVFTNGATTTRSVASSAPAGTEVGRPVTATDVDGDTLRYSLISADFAINEFSGQITVRPSRTLTPGDVTVVVTVDDQSGASNATAAIDVTATVTTGPVGPPVITGGGGGGGPSGPSPSEVDFEWNVNRDIKELDRDHDIPSGMWSDGTTLWLAENGDRADDAIYAYDLKTGERVEERARDGGQAAALLRPYGLKHVTEEGVHLVYFRVEGVHYF